MVADNHSSRYLAFSYTSRNGYFPDTFIHKDLARRLTIPANRIILNRRVLIVRCFQLSGNARCLNAALTVYDNNAIWKYAAFAINSRHGSFDNPKPPESSLFTFSEPSCLVR